MQKRLVILLVSLSLMLVMFGCQDASDEAPVKAEKQVSAPAKKEEAPADKVGPKGCSPEYRAIFDQAVVEMRGKGDLDVVVITDPLCWHCRLGHKLLGEYPEKYGRLRLSFFPRKSFIGSDMGAWVLEDVAGTDKVQAYVDYAYSDLKQPKTDDLLEARMLVLLQFTEKFPELLDGTTIEELYVRLQKDHEAHVLESAALSRAAKIPGTPILVAGDEVLMGFGPGPWLDAMDAKKVCE